MTSGDKFYNLWQFAHARAIKLSELSNQYDLFADFISDLYSSYNKDIDKVPAKVKDQIDEFLKRAEIAISGSSYADAAFRLDYFINNNDDDIRYFRRRIQEED